MKIIQYKYSPNINPNMLDIDSFDDFNKNLDLYNEFVFMNKESKDVFVIDPSDKPSDNHITLKSLRDEETTTYHNIKTFFELFNVMLINNIDTEKQYNILDLINELNHDTTLILN